LLLSFEGNATIPIIPVDTCSAGAFLAAQVRRTPCSRLDAPPFRWAKVIIFTENVTTRTKSHFHLDAAERGADGPRHPPPLPITERQLSRLKSSMHALGSDIISALSDSSSRVYALIQTSEDAPKQTPAGSEMRVYQPDELTVKRGQDPVRICRRLESTMY
jgi:hypothetical protein